MNLVEKKICKITNRKFCIFTGSGTTAMYLYFKSLNYKGKIVFPSITCRHAVNAAVYAGREPIFCDVNITDYTINIESFTNIIKNNKIACVVATHVFGNICNLAQINMLSKKYEIKVLEDAAQSFGSKYKGKLTDSKCDASVLSFGYSKNIDCGGGGAIIINNKNLYNKLMKINNLLNNKSLNYTSEYKKYKDNYYSNKYKVKNNFNENNHILNYEKKTKKCFYI